MSIYDEIGETIIHLCQQKGFTQERLALECEISVSYLRFMEPGDANPAINELWRIAKVLEAGFCSPFVVPVVTGAL